MRKLIKFLLNGLFYLIVLPFGLLSKLEYKLIGSTVFFVFFAQGASLVPGIIGTIVRRCFYNQTLKKAHLDLDIGFGSYVSKINTSIGRQVLITSRTTIGYATIGDRAVIANGVSILSGRYQHNFTDPLKNILDDNDKYSQVVIGNDSFVGDKCIIMANIGEKAIIGAGSVLVKDIPSFCVAVGNPAKVIKKRN